MGMPLHRPTPTFRAFPCAAESSDKQIALGSHATGYVSAKS